MLGFILGALCIGLGVKAFSTTGLPLTKTKNLTGTTGKVLGVVCFLLGLFFLFDAVLATMNIAHILSGGSSR